MTTESLWIQEGVLYEIYIRSFFDHSGSGSGDFRGISDKMAYISRLGVKGIILNCPFQAIAGNSRHPLTDWMRPDPLLGTLSDFLMVIEKAHSLGIKVLLSLPVNATSDRHLWFLESKDRSSRYLRRSYFWSERLKMATSPSQETPEVANWAKDEETGQYYWYQDHKDEPALNYGDPEILEEIRRVFEHWLTLEIDGFRLAGSGRLHRMRKNAIELVTDPFRQFQALLDPLRQSFPDKVFLFESGTPVRGRLREDPRLYFHFNSFFPSVMSAIRNENKEDLALSLRTGGRKIHEQEDRPIHWTLDLRERSEETFEKFRQGEGNESVFPLEPDQPENRPILSRLARVMENGRRRIQLAISLFLTTPGIPVLYYGDEIGMGDHPHLSGRNPIRTPMQWSGDRNAGFSKADPEELYNPVIDDPLYSYTMVNVESQERFPDSHLWNVRRMVEARNREKALASRGQFGVVESGHPSIYAFYRRSGGEICLLVHNLSKTSACGDLRLEKFAGLVPHELFGGAVFPKIPKHPYLVTMTPYSFIWFTLLSPVRPGGPRRKGASR